MHKENDPAKTDFWTLAPGELITPRFGDYMNGPVEVRACVDGGDWSNGDDRRDTIASQRVL